MYSILNYDFNVSHIQAEPSPTTSTFSMPFMVKGLANSSLSPPGEQSNSTHGDGHSGSFEFQLNIQSGLSSLAPLVIYVPISYLIRRLEYNSFPPQFPPCACMIYWAI